MGALPFYEAVNVTLITDGMFCKTDKPCTIKR